MFARFVWPDSWPRFCARLMAYSMLLACGLSAARAAEEEEVDEGYMAIVTANPGKIMDGPKVLATVPQGTRLWIFREENQYADVKLPNSEVHGWLSEKSYEELQFTKQQEAQNDEANKLYEKYEEFFKADKLPDALKSMEACLRHVRAGCGEHPDVAGILLDLGRLHTHMDNLPAARKAFDEALVMQRKITGNKHSHVGLCLQGIGDVLTAQGDYGNARKHFEEGFKILSDTLGKESESTGLLLNSFANLETVMGNFEAARQRYDEALIIFRASVGNEHDSTGIALNNLGEIAKELGDYAAARKYLDESLAISRKNYGEGNSDSVHMLKNLGLLAGLQGDLPAARKFYEDALAINRKAYGEQHTMTATLLGNLGMLVANQGDFAAARKFDNEALAIIRKLYGNEHTSTAQALVNLAELLILTKDFDEAQKILAEVLVINRKVDGNTHPATGMTLTLLGDVALEQEKYPQAQAFFDEALKIFRKVYGDEHQHTLGTLHSLARLEIKQRKYSQAWQRLNDVLAVLRRNFGKEHPHTIATLSELAKLAVLEKETDDAQRRWEEIRKIERRHTQYLLSALSSKEQLRYLEQNYQPNWFDCLSFAWQHRDTPGVVNLSASWLINGKAIAQESLAERELIARDLSNPQLAPRVKELQDVRRRLASLSLSAPKAAEATAHQAKLLQLANDEHRLAQALAAETGQEKIRRDWVELGALRRSLAAEAVYVDLVRMPIRDFTTDKNGEPHYLAWIIPAHGQGNVQLHDLGPAEPIEQAVQRVRQALANAAASDGALRQQGEGTAAAEAARELQAAAKLVLEPLMPALGSAKKLILSPDGALWLLPWSALPTAQDKLLLEQFAVRYILSGRDLIPTAAIAKLVPSGAAIFANPDFDLAGPVANTPESKPAAADEEATRGLVSQSKLPRVGQLPFTALEAAAAQPFLKQLSGNEPQLFAEANALEARAKTLKRPRQLLFATHGFFLPDQEAEQQQRSASGNKTGLPTLSADGQVFENPLLRCGLLLAGCNAPPVAGADDGILTGLEIVGMDLRGTELVVLSACETGVGKVRNGEGVAGLRQAFQLAGAQSVVSTLWQVPDRDSALVMQDFFTNLAAGQAKDEALRNAQLKRIAARKEKSGAAHPFFWAAWTVTGE